MKALQGRRFTDFLHVADTQLFCRFVTTFAESDPGLGHYDASETPAASLHVRLLDVPRCSVSVQIFHSWSPGRGGQIHHLVGVRMDDEELRSRLKRAPAAGSNLALDVFPGNTDRSGDFESGTRSSGSSSEPCPMPQRRPRWQHQGRVKAQQTSRSSSRPKPPPAPIHILRCPPTG